MNQIELLTSPANPLLKGIRRAQKCGGLTEDGWCILEGRRFVADALSQPAVAARIRCLVGTSGSLGFGNGHRRIEIPDTLFGSISGTESPQGILALIDPPRYTAADFEASDALVLVLDGVQDPGNVGAISRVAEAFGAKGLLFRHGTASPFHPRTLRASSGSLLRLPFLQGDEAEKVLARFPLLAAVPADRGAIPISKIDLRQKCAVGIGSEGNGVSPDLLARARRVSIPTRGVESLNAAMAATVFLYEADRQRTQATR